MQSSFGATQPGLCCSDQSFTDEKTALGFASGAALLWTGTGFSCNNACATRSSVALMRSDGFVLPYTSDSRAECVMLSRTTVNVSLLGRRYKEF